MIFSWGFFSLANLIMQTVSNQIKDMDYQTEQAIAITAFALIYIRNLSIALIAFIYSVLKQKFKYGKNEQNEDVQGDNLGLHAIDDFDTAMKSIVPVKYFRNFVNSWNDFTNPKYNKTLPKTVKTPPRISPLSKLKY